MIYLDTHVVVALRQGVIKGYSKEAQRLLDRDPDPRISPMVILELAFLRDIRRLRAPAEEIVAALAADFGLRVCDRPFEQVARQAAQEAWTRDPFDRMIVAQARLAGQPLITLERTVHTHYRHSMS